jgi:integrase/recombinase XerD
MIIQLSEQLQQQTQVLDIFINSYSNQNTVVSSLRAIIALVKGVKSTAVNSIYDFNWTSITYQSANLIKIRLQEKYALNTANKHLSFLRALVKELALADLVTTETAFKIQSIKSIKGTVVPTSHLITDEEVVELLNKCNNGTVHGVRDYVAFYLMLTLGLRASEVVALKWIHLELIHKQVTVHKGKGNKTRVIPLSDAIINLLKQWRTVNDLDYIICVVNGTNTIMNFPLSYSGLSDRLAKYATFKLHDMRRRFITQLLEQQQPIDVVAGIVGHSNIQTTSRYNLSQLKNQRKVMENTNVLPPLPDFKTNPDS